MVEFNEGYSKLDLYHLTDVSHRSRVLVVSCFVNEIIIKLVFAIDVIYVIDCKKNNQGPLDSSNVNINVAFKSRLHMRFFTSFCVLQFC